MACFPEAGDRGQGRIVRGRADDRRTGHVGRSRRRRHGDRGDRPGARVLGCRAPTILGRQLEQDLGADVSVGERVGGGVLDRCAWTAARASIPGVRVGDPGAGPGAGVRHELRPDGRGAADRRRGYVLRGRGGRKGLDDEPVGGRNGEGDRIRFDDDDVIEGRIGGPVRVGDRVRVAGRRGDRDTTDRHPEQNRRRCAGAVVPHVGVAGGPRERHRVADRCGRDAPAVRVGEDRVGPRGRRGEQRERRHGRDHRHAEPHASRQQSSRCTQIAHDSSRSRPTTSKA